VSRPAPVIRAKVQAPVHDPRPAAWTAPTLEQVARETVERNVRQLNQKGYEVEGEAAPPAYNPESRHGNTAMAPPAYQE